MFTFRKLFMNKIMQILQKTYFLHPLISLLDNATNATNAINATNATNAINAINPINAIDAISMAITQFMKQNHGSSLLRLKSKRKPQI